MEYLKSLLRFEAMLAILIIGFMLFLYSSELTSINQEVTKINQELKKLEFFKRDSALIPDAAFQRINERINIIEQNFEHKQNILMKSLPYHLRLLFFCSGPYIK